MGFFRDQTFALAAADSARPIDYRLSDRRVVFTPEPTPSSCSSLSDEHMSMGFFRNQTFALPSADSVRPIDYSVSDSRVSSTPVLHLLYPPSVSEASISSSFSSSSFITPTPFTSSPTSFCFIRYNKLTERSLLDPVHCVAGRVWMSQNGSG
jgi:hypothetical protein